MEALRTEAERFAAVPDFAYEPRYIVPLAAMPGLRMAYIDEGSGPEVALCLHGQPSWSFLYRKLIPPFLRAGVRVVAPDLFGFGRSDKPVHDADYTFGSHRDALLGFVRALDLRRITLVCQDWGGLLGLTLPLEMPERFERLIVMNTGLGTGDVPLGAGFLAWRAFSNAHPDMDIAALMRRAVPGLTEAEAAAYAAPFPDQRYKAGVRRFPNLVPDNPEADGAAISRQARQWWQRAWQGQSFMVVGMQDPVLGPPAMRVLHGSIRGCPPPLELPNAGHFVQEAGAVIVERALAHFANVATNRPGAA
jgi:haloalkane dehalogenase/tRNA(adenine34) deaminase